MKILNARQLQTAAFGALLPLAVACDATTGPRVTAADVVARVTIVGDSARATTTDVPSVTWMSFPIDISVTNNGTVPIRFEPCASSVEQRIGTVWMTAWRPVCALAGTVTELQQGETRRQTIQVLASLQGAGAPVWTGTSRTGNIRFVAALVPRGFSGRIPTLASNEVPFVVRD